MIQILGCLMIVLGAIAVFLGLVGAFIALGIAIGVWKESLRKDRKI